MVVSTVCALNPSANRSPPPYGHNDPRKVSSLQIWVLNAEGDPHHLADIAIHERSLHSGPPQPGLGTGRSRRHPLRAQLPAVYCQSLASPASRIMSCMINRSLSKEEDPRSTKALSSLYRRLWLPCLEGI